MDNWPPLISSDGSSNRNPPERCPRYSTQEHHKTLGCYQYKKLKRIKTEVKEEADELSVMDDDLCMEKEIPPEISTDPGDTKETPRDVKAEEEEEGNVRIKEEEIPIKISTDPGDTRETPRKVKAEEDDEEHVNTKGKAILEIGIDGQYRLQNTDKYPTTSPDGEIAGDDVAACITEENPIMPNQQPVLREEKSFSCLECGKCFTRKHSLIVHQRLHTGEKPYLCLECGKCFYSRPQLHEHQKTHPEVAAFSCSKCLKRFRTSRILALHQSIHSR